jgi:chorismate mutase
MDLRAQKDRIDAEISAYPRPITACDAQFNALLAERARLAEALEREKAQSSSTATPLEKAT